MKRYELLLNIGIGVLAFAIILVVIFKFVIVKKPADPFAINNIEEATVFDLSGSELKLDHLIPQNDTIHVLIFNLKDCHSCISDGVEILKKLRKEGRQCFGVAIHDRVEDVDGWTINFDFSPFYMMKTVVFVDHFNIPITPILLKFNNRKVERHSYLLPH
jgi:hypothetical protein